MCQTLASACVGVQYSAALQLCDVFGSGGAAPPPNVRDTANQTRRSAVFNDDKASVHICMHYG
jgi:hypothetical protein